MLLIYKKLIVRLWACKIKNYKAAENIDLSRIHIAKAIDQKSAFNFSRKYRLHGNTLKQIINVIGTQPLYSYQCDIIVEAHSPRRVIGESSERHKHVSYLGILLLNNNTHYTETRRCFMSPGRKKSSLALQYLSQTCRTEMYRFDKYIARAARLAVPTRRMQQKGKGKGRSGARSNASKQVS